MVTTLLVTTYLDTTQNSRMISSLSIKLHSECTQDCPDVSRQGSSTLANSLDQQLPENHGNNEQQCPKHQLVLNQKLKQGLQKQLLSGGGRWPTGGLKGTDVLGKCPLVIRWTSENSVVCLLELSVRLLLQNIGCS